MTPSKGQKKPSRQHGKYRVMLFHLITTVIVLLLLALGGVGIPLDGLAVLLGVDRIPDMARTATNVVGVLTAGAVVDRTGETQDSAVTTED